MVQRLRKVQNEREDGFTLIELLIVIVILGILAGIVVFAVGGITDRGQASACKADRKTLQVAEEANFAQNTTYTTEALLVPKFIAEASTLYDVTASSATAYTIAPSPAGVTAGCV